MHVSTNWPLVIFVITAGIVLYTVVQYAKNEKIIVAVVAIFTLGLIGYGISSDKSYTDRVTIAETQLQKYATEMQSMGVKHISFHANPVINSTYSIISARKDGKYYNETSFADRTSPTSCPTPMSSWEYYIASMADLAMSAIAPTMAIGNKPIAEIKMVDGKVIVKANRDLVKKVGPVAISMMMTAITEFHLKRLARAEGVPYQI